MNCKHWEILLRFIRKSDILNAMVHKVTEAGAWMQVQNMKGDNQYGVFHR